MLKWQRTQKIMALVPPAKAPSDDSSTSEDEVIINNYTKPKKQQSSDSEHNYESSEPRSYPSEIDDLSLDSHSEDEIPATPSPRPLQLQNESKSYLPNSKENSRPTTPPSPTPPQQNDCNIPEVPCSEVQTPISSASMPQDIMNDSILHIPTIPLSPLINQMFSPGPSNQPLPFTLNSVSSVLSPNMSPAAPNTRSKRRQNTKPKHPAAKKVKKFVRKPLSFKFRAGKLQYLATGRSFRSLAFSFRVSNSAVGIIVRETCKAIFDSLVSHHMPMPTDEMIHQNAELYWSKWGFPNCIGSLYECLIDDDGDDQLISQAYDQLISQAFVENNETDTSVLTHNEDSASHLITLDDLLGRCSTSAKTLKELALDALGEADRKKKLR
ncbi:unnamed protein product [Parnassius apollo]|uniref:(apollo) hypothetical protein n=1 Tax=Parnassius apollo TaxID=110799 RepID=A0A8S3XIZ8_PARAO|nr:unnamed protein product [Parnassius apollo]